MDPITTAIAAALSAGAVSGLTETSKMTIVDVYQTLNAYSPRNAEPGVKWCKPLTNLEAEPELAGCKETLHQEIVAVKVEQDNAVLAAAKHVLAQVHPQQAGLGKFTIQNNAPLQGQTMGDHNTITQQFGEMPKV